MTTVEMIVNMDCHGCERKVRKALQKLDGVESIDIDLNLQKVTVIGYVDQEKVLRKVRRTGKKAELWPFPDNPEVIGFTQQYADVYTSHSDPSTYFHVQQQEITSTYNYDRGDYNNYGQPELPYSSVDVGYRFSTAFNDENVYACSIM